jgi:hypothetical protein
MWHSITLTIFWEKMNTFLRTNCLSFFDQIPLYYLSFPEAGISETMLNRANSESDCRKKAEITASWWWKWRHYNDISMSGSFKAEKDPEHEWKELVASEMTHYVFENAEYHILNEIQEMIMHKIQLGGVLNFHQYHTDGVSEVECIMTGLWIIESDFRHLKLFCSIKLYFVFGFFSEKASQFHFQSRKIRIRDPLRQDADTFIF